jgi:signal peptidase I
MSSAGRGVTPGPEPDAGSEETVASATTDQERSPASDRPPASDNGFKAADGEAAGASGTAKSAGAAAGDESAAGDGGSAEDGGRRTARRRPRKKRSFWREFPVLVAVALLLAVVIKTYAVQAFFIPSGSMENTLQVNDRVLVNKLVYDVRGIHRGDIVVFNGDGSWDPGKVPGHTNFFQKFTDGFASMFGFGKPGDILIKRVIGLPGDRVICCDAQRRVTVNGVPLNEQSYLYPGDVPSRVSFNITVPPGRLWVMGDHRLISDDSRDHLGKPGGGTVPESAVIGRAFVIIWPISRWRTLPIPDTFEQPKLGASSSAPPDQDAALLSARLKPSSPLLPLSLGFAAAIPVTWLQRRGRLRLARRREARRDPGRPRGPGGGPSGA